MQLQTTLKITGLASKSEIARRLDVKPQLVSYWFKRGVPPHWIIPFCSVLNWVVTPHQIDPQLYPNPTDALPTDHNISSHGA